MLCQSKRRDQKRGVSLCGAIPGPRKDHGGRASNFRKIQDAGLSATWGFLQEITGQNNNHIGKIGNINDTYQKVQYSTEFVRYYKFERYQLFLILEIIHTPKSSKYRSQITLRTQHIFTARTSLSTRQLS